MLTRADLRRHRQQMADDKCGVSWRTGFYCFKCAKARSLPVDGGFHDDEPVNVLTVAGAVTDVDYLCSDCGAVMLDREEKKRAHKLLHEGYATVREVEQVASRSQGKAHGEE